MQNPTEIQAKLNPLRRRLIDTSLRNPFLNYRSSRSTNLEIVSPSVANIFETLVVQGKSVCVETLPRDESVPVRDRGNRAIPLLVSEDESRLQQKLLRIWRTAVGFQEEQGINALYLALGKFEWYESEASEARLIAPLVFVPLQIERLQGDTFHLRYEGTEVVYNLVFAEKLRQDFRVEMPAFAANEDSNGDELGDYFASVCSATSQMKRWRIDREFKAISFFNFTKFVIYKDLDPDIWIGDGKSVSASAIQLLLGESEQGASEAILTEEEKLDVIRPVATSLEVFDADSSQIAAIVQSKHSRVLIIEGPPGTGKSQTIANLIAEAIYEGKRVLFVSEKKAALDVVWQRLQEAGISQACLELHSNKANKKSFYEQIRNALHTEVKTYAELERELDTLSRLRDTLNLYYSTLHSPLLERGVSPYACLTKLCQLGSVGVNARVSFASMHGWTYDDFLRREELILRIQTHIRRHGLPSHHPLWGIGIERMLPTDFEVILQSTAETLSVLRESVSSDEVQALTKEEIDRLRGVLENAPLEETERLATEVLTMKRYHHTWFRRLVPGYRAALHRARRVLGDTTTESELLKFTYASERICAIERSLQKLVSLLKARDPLLQWASLPFEDLEKRLEQLLGLSYDEILPLVRYNQLRSEAFREQLRPWVSWAESNEQYAESLRLVYQYTWYAGVLQEAFATSPILHDFAEDAENIVEQFRMKDRSLLRLNRLRVAIKHQERMPRYRAAGNLAVLQRELQKTRAHKPIRRIMQEAGDAIVAIKPVFMMSPLSVATYLPAGNPIFDLVIFDEASQIKPEDAFSAILRAKQVIIVGDTKQLPPTNFFDRLTDEDEANDDDIAIGLDSILDLASATIPEGSPHRRLLRWHYRSKHPSLITCSNSLFYDNRLIVPPCPETEPKQVGMVFHHLHDTTYDRGRTRKNWQEAQTIAQSVISHLRLYPELSLGVVALSVQQQEAIWDAIESALRDSPDAEILEAHNKRHVREPLFVKNLETVQGDERDVIFVSVGYGRDERGILSMNFGPINKEGGEKRLNVLFTRARLRCEIFSNFRWSDMRIEPDSSKGVSALRTFLHYAETGHLDLPVTSNFPPMSPFEESVIRVLEEEGYEVVPQVGSAGFYIDIGVLHPERLGKFVLGIECDGARYHSSKTARDRDRLRQEVLERHGWRIYRIWSTSWYRHYANERERLLNAVRQAIEEDDASQRTSEEPQVPQTVTESPNLKEPDFTVHTSQLSSQKNPRPIEFRKYKMADLSRFAQHLHSALAGGQTTNLNLIAQVVENIVSTESPIHIEELIRRIREAAHFARAGRNIRDSIVRGVVLAKGRGKVDFDGKFVSKRTSDLILPRGRQGFPSQYKKIEYIHPLEIRQAIIEVTRLSFGIGISEVCSEVLRCFGFERVTEQMRQAVRQEVDALLKQGMLRLDATTLRPAEMANPPKQV